MSQIALFVHVICLKPSSEIVAIVVAIRKKPQELRQIECKIQNRHVICRRHVFDMSQVAALVRYILFDFIEPLRIIPASEISATAFLTVWLQLLKLALSEPQRE